MFIKYCEKRFLCFSIHVHYTFTSVLLTSCNSIFWLVVDIKYLSYFFTFSEGRVKRSLWNTDCTFSCFSFFLSMPESQEVYIPQHMQAFGEALVSSQDEFTRNLPINRALERCRRDIRDGYVYRIFPGESGIVES
ncbi:hypothetical protein A2880_01625 [Candidatus Peribacteria bacterium RIFCSPHIGHO2_01_FULL_49_38]|nr:MAG: hypothetical protein A2880_01625 [Candidatus Peribacteria bacterium RIFCSPHIGHO2_01_FULL_49_38]